MDAHLFNPTCEMEVANGNASYMPPAHLAHFSENLSTLPFVYAKANDVVLVEKLLPQTYCESLIQAGFSLPKFHLLSKVAELSDYTPKPWGWSPSVAYKLRSLGAVWNTELYAFFSRRFALKILEELQLENCPQILQSSHKPVFATNISEVEGKLKEWGKVVTKAPFSSSGRGLQIVQKTKSDTNIYHKIRKTIAQQGGVMVEPFLKVLCNFAYEFKIEKGKLQFLGYSSFETHENGQYLGQKLPFSTKNLPREVIPLFDNGVVKKSLTALCNTLENSDLVEIYEGYFGVDAFVFGTDDEQVWLQPCVEINLRCTMGIVALHLEKHLAKGSHGIFKIVSQNEKSLEDFHKKMLQKYPLRTENSKIVSGYLPLTPLTKGTHNLAYLMAQCSKVQ